MRRIAMLALVVTVASCAEGIAPDGGLPEGVLPDGGLTEGVIPDGGKPVGGNSDGGVETTSTYSVTGAVKGPGQSNAALTLQGANTPRTVTSNASGEFQFLNVPAGDYTLTAFKKGFVYSPSTQPVKVVSADVKVTDMGSVAEQAGYAVSGAVTGDLTAKVLLTLTQEGVTVGTTFSSDVGVYRLDGVADGTYTMTPSLAGYTFTPVSRPLKMEGKAITGLDFTMKAVPYALSGTISGDVKAGVALSLVGNGKKLEATTDATGVYSIAGATDGTYTLTPSLVEYTFTPASRSVTVAGKAMTGQDFTATGVPHAVGGTVSGDIKAGVAFTLVGNGKSLTGTTDGTGAFSIAGATNGTYTLTPSLAGYAFTPATRTVTVVGAVVAGQDFTSNAVLSAVSGAISGDVKAGVILSLVGNGKQLNATTDASGTFTVAGATMGTYTLTPSLVGYTFTPATRTVTMAGAAVGGQDFTVQAVPYAVSGIVSGDVKAGVVLSLVGNGRTLNGMSDTNGVFTVANATAGTYTLTPSLAGYTFTPASLTVTVVGANVTGQGFTSAALKFSVSGTVSGDAPTGVLLKLSQNGATDLTTLTASGGAFRFDGALAGSYTLTPTLEGYTFTPASRSVVVSGATVTAQDFTSKAEKSAVSGTLSGDIKEGVTLILSGNGEILPVTTDANGAYSISGAKNGTYTLTPSRPGYAFTPPSWVVVLSGGAAIPKHDFISRVAKPTLSGTVSGSVTAYVNIIIEGDKETLSTTTDSRGSYSIDLPRNGTYTVRPNYARFDFTPESRVVTMSGAQVSGQDFSSYPGRIIVSGIVSGDIKEGVTITLEGPWETLTATTDSTGAFSARVKQNAMYTLKPSYPGYSFAPLSKIASMNSDSRAGMNFTATKMKGAVSGVLRGDIKAGVTFTLVGNGKSLSATTDKSGYFYIADVPYGTYTLAPNASGFAFTPPSRTVVLGTPSAGGQVFESRSTTCIGVFCVFDYR